MLFISSNLWGKQRKSVVRKVADRKKDAQRGDTGIAKSCLTLCDPMKCSQPCSSVHGISQARIQSGFPFPSPGVLMDTGIGHILPPAWQADSLPLTSREAVIQG